jgi:hypothetical protein
LPGLEEIRAFVLGPPKDVKRIRKMNPNKDEGYRHLADTSSLEGAIKALAAKSSDEAAKFSPFEERYGIGADDARVDPFFRDFYGFDDDAIGDTKNAWRKIDGAGLSDIGRLALQLDTGVNNTSLALAFELPNGRTLIFPGDAQIGNWLSWDSVEFEDEKGKMLDVTAKGLLNRAAFYKVGHHGSHNATRRTGGLEEMTSGDLVAMIPTDEAFALTQSPPHGWKMPFFELYEALKKFTGCRIARADFAKDEMTKLFDDPKKANNNPAWTRFVNGLRFAPTPLLASMKNRPMFVECKINL